MHRLGLSLSALVAGLFLVLAATAAPGSLEAGEDGAALFTTYCSTCHGAEGKGDGAASAALDPKPADFSKAEFWASRDDALIKKVIKEGGAAVGKSAMMAPWGSVLNDAQIDAVIAHIKTFKK